MKPGYRQTEIGVIPEDWEVPTVGEISRVIRGASPRPKGDKRFYGGPVPRLMVEDVTRDGKIVFPKIDTLTEEGAKLSRPCKKGTLTIVCSGTVGIPSLLGVDACIHDGFLALVSIRKDVSSDYLYYQFDRLRLSFESSATHGGVFTNLTTEGVRRFIVPLPSTLTEQRAIAASLGDMDALLGGLDRLITKKRDTKQAVAQRLLTGEFRLPGFQGEWKMSSVGAEYEITLGKMLDAEKNVGVPKPYLGNKDVQWGRVDISDLPTVPMSRTDLLKFRLRKGDLLVCEGGEVGRAAIWNAPIDECYFQKALHRLRPLRGFNSLLLAAFLRHWSDCGLLANYVTQTSIAHLPREKFLEVPMPVPSIPEQDAIAAVLADMDAEIVALEDKLAKVQAVKQGMMQVLLNGEVRLV